MPVTWFDDVTITVEAALSASTGTYGAWDAGLWDAATWGPEVTWTDISAYLRGFSTQRGFSREVQSWQAGSATVVLNNPDGRFSPAKLDGPYVTAGVTQIRPWRPIRIYVTHGGVTYHILRGYILAWQESYVEAGPGTGVAIVTLPCTDESGRIGGFNGLEQPAAGAGELSGLRIHRILDNAGHTGTRNIDIGSATMQATTLSGNALTELQLTADSEGGALFIAADGTVTFEGVDALVANARSSTVQSTWGDGPGELPYSNMTSAYGGDLTANIVSFARVGGTAQIQADPTSRALYGDLLPESAKRADLICQTDAQADALASWHLAQYKDPELRVTKIEVKPRHLLFMGALYPQVFGREVRDLIRVRRRPPGGHTITRDVHIAGVGHVVTSDNWVTTFDLWSATAYQTVGRWDYATWDSSTWFI